MDPELVSDAMPLADAMQRYPRPWRVGDVVVPTVERRPAGHGALLDPVDEAPRLRLTQQRNELLLEHLQVRIHLELHVAADEPAHGIDTEQDGGIEYPQHEIVLGSPGARIINQHVVEVRHIGYAHSRRAHRRAHAARAGLIEGLTQIEGVRDRVE